MHSFLCRDNAQRHHIAGFIERQRFIVQAPRPDFAAGLGGGVVIYGRVSRMGGDIGDPCERFSFLDDSRAVCQLDRERVDNLRAVAGGVYSYFLAV